jgi:cell division protein FtsW
MSDSNVQYERSIQDSTNRAMRTLLLCVFFLTAAGWVMLFDSGIIFEGHADPAHFYNLLSKRMLCSIIGLAALGFFWILPTEAVRKFSPVVMILGVVLLVLVWTPLGVLERGSRRWVSLGPFTFQPLEFAKLALVWYIADRFARLGPLGRVGIDRLAAPMAFVFMLILLVGMQPNLSGAMFLILLTFAMACLGGINRRLLLTLSGTGIAAMVALLAKNPDRLERFLPVFKPLTDLGDSGYQVGLSLWAITNGGLLGRGPGNSIAMYSLPDHTTDFTYSILCEEFGLIGGAIVILLFAALVYSGFRIALSQENPFRMLLGCGITTIIGLQTATNIGVTLGVLPTTGVPLPFLSAAGTNLVVSLMEVGILLNLGRTAGKKSPAMVRSETPHKRPEPVIRVSNRRPAQRHIQYETEIRRRIAQ